ncbi:hypothetical protein L903_01210 [Agrobacterium sp. JL28]|nr:hypothetical protein L903_01210 [Agrobacterium sp. JL28]KVK53425.1 hypothetical protein L904_03695 [Agrobacterium sp. LY4]
MAAMCGVMGLQDGDRLSAVATLSAVIPALSRND